MTAKLALAERYRSFALLALAACGGGQKPPPEEPKVSPKITTRHVIEDDSDEEGPGEVQVVGARGRMDVGKIQQGLAPHTTAMGECYTSRVAKRRWLGGNVELHWEISAAGEITAVKMASSDLGNWPIEKCLLEVARLATFEAPVGGDTDFQLPLNFSAKGGAQLWDDTQSLRAVGGQTVALEACDKALVKRNAQDAKDAAKKKPAKGEKPTKFVPAELPEDVAITVYVGAKGVAQSVGFATKASVIDPEWGDCAEKAAMAWRLTDPRGQIAKLFIKYKAAADGGDE